MEMKDSGFSVQVSAQSSTRKAAGLIEKETLALQSFRKSKRLTDDE